jgi:sugar transferase (PEP-CTERM/EpsH1 system associated)
MKLLFVAPSLPYPPLTGNALIAFNHIKHLSRCHTVDVISLGDRKNQTKPGDLARWCNNIELVEPLPFWRAVLHKGSHLIRDPHPDIALVSSRKMVEVVDRRLANTTYDVVLFHLEYAAQFRPDWYHGPTVWSLEDPWVVKIQRMLPMYSWYLRPLYRRWSERLKSYDRKEAPRFSRVIFVNKEDADEYKRIAHEACTDWVPHGIDDEIYSPSTEIPRRDGMIVITGNMYHLPNVDAVDFFCREIFPRVYQRMPSANLWLVGSRPVDRVRRWTKNPRIKVTGFVPDIRPYLQEATVSVCPVRLKIGTQTKILEALACATPVVTTSAGNHGICASSGNHLYVADDPEEFADRVVELLKGERWKELSENGRRFVQENFTWSRSGLKLEQIFEQLAATSTRQCVTSESHSNQTHCGNDRP